METSAEKRYPVFFAAQSKDEGNVEQSSSGGIFYELCRGVSEHQGIIYGAAAVSPICVEHLRAENLLQAEAFRRSKYIRSQCGRCFGQVKADLQKGRRVLFSGVGCQIAGLYQYLGNRYDNLITCEMVCHGMPLDETMEKYIEEKEAAYGERLTAMNFRDKRYGWKQNCIAEYYESGRYDVILSSEHPVHSLYLKGINMSSGCASCKYAGIPRIADITLADFWQYEGKIDHKDKGMSLVSVNTIKGMGLFERIKQEINWEPTTETLALASCRHMAHAPAGHKNQTVFQELLRERGFLTAYALCGSGQEVVVAEELQKIEDLEEDRIFDIFEKDTHEIIYVVDRQDYVKGIVTFGAFLTGYASGEGWVNPDFQSINLGDVSTIREAGKIFAENKKINRIPVFDEEGKLLYEVRKETGMNGKKDARKSLIPFARLKHNHNKCLFIKRPDLSQDIGNYKEREINRIRNQISFPVMQADWDKYQKDLKEIFEEDVTRDYINALCEIPQIIMRGRRSVHADGCSRYVNIIDGCRLTVKQPKDYLFTIHMYGRCGVFGYAVEDKDTMPSALQAILNENGEKIRVENHGLWGADDEKILKNISIDLDEGTIQQEDVVVVYMAGLPWMEELEIFSVKYYDTTLIFHEFLNKGGTFFDRPGHMTAKGYAFIARYLYQKLKETGSLNQDNLTTLKTKYRTRAICNQKNPENMDIELRKYLDKTKELIAAKDLETDMAGAIVMNCNPFTNGHRYLIEEAMKYVEVLFLFVLEEDRSYYSFEDRFQMVKLGTEDLEKVYVIPSGKFIISAMTFPEYFLKEYQPDITIQAANDVSLFGRYIAPFFHIKKRFAGTEPTDKVTAQYNEQMKKILPLYGVELCEIPRLRKGNSYVTATEVRRCMERHDWMRVKELVPYSTYQYLMPGKVI